MPFPFSDGLHWIFLHTGHQGALQLLCSGFINLMTINKILSNRKNFTHFTAYSNTHIQTHRMKVAEATSKSACN